MEEDDAGAFYAWDGARYTSALLPLLFTTARHRAVTTLSYNCVYHYYY
jgi:hypothetical protein